VKPEKHVNVQKSKRTEIKKYERQRSMPNHSRSSAQEKRQKGNAATSVKKKKVESTGGSTLKNKNKTKVKKELKKNHEAKKGAFFRSTPLETADMKGMYIQGGAMEDV